MGIHTFLVARAMFAFLSFALDERECVWQDKIT